MLFVPQKSLEILNPTTVQHRMDLREAPGETGQTTRHRRCVRRSPETEAGLGLWIHLKVHQCFKHGVSSSIRSACHEPMGFSHYCEPAVFAKLLLPVLLAALSFSQGGCGRGCLVHVTFCSLALPCRRVPVFSSRCRGS